jgi:hypothetical protein
VAPEADKEASQYTTNRLGFAARVVAHEVSDRVPKFARLILILQMFVMQTVGRAGEAGALRREDRKMTVSSKR